MFDKQNNNPEKFEALCNRAMGEVSVAMDKLAQEFSDDKTLMFSRSGMKMLMDLWALHRHPDDWRREQDPFYEIAILLLIWSMKDEGAEFLQKLAIAQLDLSTLDGNKPGQSVHVSYPDECTRQEVRNSVIDESDIRHSKKDKKVKTYTTKITIEGDNAKLHGFSVTVDQE